MKRTEQSIPEDFNYELLISNQQGVETEWKLISEDEHLLPIAWIYLKFGIEESNIDEREAINLVQNLAAICADLEVGVIIGSWRGLYVDFVEEFYTSRDDKDSREFVKILAESDHKVFKKSIHENFSIEAVNVDFRARLESYANASIMVGHTNSSEELTSNFLKNSKAVFPFFNDLVCKKYIQTLDEDEYEEIYQNCMHKNQFIGPQSHVINGFETFLQILVNRNKEI